MKIFSNFFNPLKIYPKLFKGKKKITGKRVLRFLGWTALIFVGLLTILFLYYSKDLPTPGKIQKRMVPASTQIYDRNGNILYDLHGEQRRILLDKKDIPEMMKNATIAAEDKDFYHHFGIDFRSILRAAYYDIIHRGSVQGASTITQQFVKNALLSPERTWNRKIKELILTLEVEAMYSKEDILAFYLNEIPYGSNNYGIEAASQSYFGKSVKDLTLAQTATLAALPQAPTRYSPYGPGKEKLLARKNWVLDRMATLKMISYDQAEEAKKQELTFVPRAESITAPHFVFLVREILADRYGEQMVEQGGLKVTTTLDLPTQKMAEEAVYQNAEKNLKKYKVNNAGLTAIDPKTGQILAMVGSADYFNEEIKGQVNVMLSQQQPGSAFKPIAYATAFKGKYNPATVLFDLQTDFGNYVPRNYDGSFRGPITIRQALANSINIPAVKTLYLAGLNNVIDQARKMGITSLDNPSRYGLSLVLGGGDVYPLELTGAFGVFGNQGKYAPTTPILKVEDSKGKVLEEWQDKAKEVLDPQIAYEINSILSDNNARAPMFGSRSSLYFPDHTVAAKTGTTSENRDAWVMGYTPSLAVGIWVGNTDNTPMSAAGAGISAAGPIFHQFMENALKNKPNEEFIRPPGIQEVTVDKFSNKLPTQYSPEKIKDIFASWQVPTDWDDIHIVVKVCKLNGKLATDQTPSDQIEEQLFTNIHSELPNNPAWEGPVRAWAQANGITNFPPTEKCEEYSQSNRPNIYFINPTSGASVSGSMEIKVTISSPYPIQSVEYLIDDISIGTSSSSPFSYIYDTNLLSSGNHILKARAKNSIGMTGEGSITFQAVKDTTAPIISGVSAGSITAHSVTISWITNESSDSQVEYGLTSSYGSLTPVNTTMATNHSIQLTGLNNSTIYHYRVKSKDSSGNLAISADFTFTTS